MLLHRPRYGGEMMEGFVFPNELHVTWSVMIVLYPYITGLVAGAFIVSSLYHVFGFTQLRPIGRFSLVSAFVFLLFAPVPLLNHLGRPERAFNILITPNFSSAMSGFGFIFAIYSIIVFLEIWFDYRADLIQRWEKAKGLSKKTYYLILLGATQRTERTDEIDHAVVKTLAGIGIPVALILHGYVGFLFGSIKANPWWSTPLMFIIFICSAVVSGMAVLIFLYQFVTWLKGIEADQVALDTLGKFLWGFMILAVSLELMEILSVAYEQTDRWSVLRELIYGRLWYTYVILQIGVCSLIPFFLLSLKNLLNLPRRFGNLILFFSSILLLCQVLLMRWNVVIGGQLLSKSYRGFTSYLPGLWEKEGLIVSALILIIPFLLLREFDKFFPFFSKKDQPVGEPG
ncbi:MAG: polysulfide reductase NrfD [Candidatus Omnitrophica bacterium]|nr:polysulfide reductase NrfD [Candidatus Omnitrophota bacterium]